MQTMEKNIFTELFNTIYETDALIIKPATDFEADRCDNDLKEVFSLSLPEDYKEFLKKIANGYAWNGFEFFGTYKVTVNKSGYVLQDILHMNDVYRNRKLGLSSLPMLLIGRFDDDIYIYNFAKKKYQSLDSLTLFEIDDYDSIEDLIMGTVAEYAYDGEDYDEDENLTEDDGNAD